MKSEIVTIKLRYALTIATVRLETQSSSYFDNPIVIINDIIHVIITMSKFALPDWDKVQAQYLHHLSDALSVIM